MGDFMGGLFGSDPSISYAQSPQAQQLMQMMMPMLSKAFGGASGQPYISGYQQPSPMSGGVGGGGGYGGLGVGDYGFGTGQPMYGGGFGGDMFSPTPIYSQGAQGGNANLWNIPNYNIPSPYKIPSAVGPTSGWYDSISPSIKQGLWEPYNEAANMLGEKMGVGGQLGSARGGYSGVAGNAFGKFYSDAGKDIGLNAWSMMQPGLQSQWQAQLGQNAGMWGEQLGQNKYMAQNQLQQNQYPWNLIPSMFGQAMPNTVVNPGQQGLLSPQTLLPLAAMFMMA